MFCAVDGRYGHGAAGCGQVDVFGALAPSCACAACEGVCNQGAAHSLRVVVNVAHAALMGGGCCACYWAPEAFKEGGEGVDHRWGGGGCGVGLGEQRGGFEDALGLAVVGVFGDAVVCGGGAAPAKAGCG